jgi:hypothetical protein
MYDGICFNNKIYIGLNKTLQVYTLDNFDHHLSIATMRNAKRILPLFNKYLVIVHLSNQWIEILDAEKEEIITTFNIQGSKKSIVYDAIKLN